MEQGDSGSGVAELIEFVASLPPIQSAMKVSGNRTGMRIQLDVAESEVPNAIRLMLLAEQSFKVKIEPFEVENERKTLHI